MQDLGIISPNMIKLFTACPAKFYYRYVEQIPTPLPDKGFLTGKNIHSIAAYYLKKENISKFEATLKEQEKIIWKTLKSNHYLQYDIVGVEKSLSCKLGKFWIGGRPDAIVKHQNDYYILDYKTGGTNSNMTYDAQTMVYLIMCHEFLSNYNSLKFVYIDLKNIKEVEIEFNEKLQLEYKKRLTDICTQMQEFKIKNFIKKDNCKCEYKKICKIL